MDLFTYLLKKKGHNSSVNGDLFSYLLASRKRGTYQTYTGTQINVVDSINARMKNWILGGNSNQNGTPTPDAPIDIHNVIGKNNVIENSGKNLYEPVVNTEFLNGLTPKIEVDGSISISGTPTQNWSNICQQVSTYLEAGTYTFSINKAQNFTCGIRVFTSKEGDFEDIIIGSGNTKTTKTVTNKIYGWRFFISGITVGTELNENIKVQIETGSTATTFEKYKGKNYKISLASKNLLNLYDKEETINGVSISIKNGEITLDGTATSTFQWKNFGVFKHIAGTPYQLIFIYESGYCSNSQSGLYLSDNPNITHNVGGGMALITGNRNQSINDLGTKDYYLYSSINSGCQFENYKVKVQIIKGTTPDYEFAPFTTSIIELCKIDNYQDKIYKQNDKWLLEKNITKITSNYLVDNATWTLWDNSIWYLQNASYKLLGIKQVNQAVLCTHLKGDLDDIVYGNTILYDALHNHLDLRFSKDLVEGDLSTKEALLNWLNTVKFIMYYVLENPIVTEITDENLINQLEELAKARSFENQTNISQLSEQLPFDLTVDIKTL